MKKLGELQARFVEEWIEFRDTDNKLCSLGEPGDNRILAFGRPGYRAMLNRQMVRSLIAHLQSWLDTGSLDFDEGSEDRNRTIANLRDGETGYTTPWTTFLDLNNQRWIWLGCLVSSTPGGSATMEITKTGDTFEIAVKPEEIMQLDRVHSQHDSKYHGLITKVSIWR